MSSWSFTSRLLDIWDTRTIGRPGILTISCVSSAGGSSYSTTVRREDPAGGERTFRYRGPAVAVAGIPSSVPAAAKLPKDISRRWKARRSKLLS
ncbi:hypothetical protein GCM10010507_19070 [Streptomyces cinnamoneus]|uniref:Uncharacterized protein n=1 Tax=Streptomyces cinnamoneus TaxID=53446 RepID=A0A918TGL7_STRCJ|nr:hypothetical protein GCM10010507_19070 [Streptomyces cinnamoneus]